ncbi:MAG: sulfur carrier protein ThiS [Phascolarctobacterium sp.]|nr:sulfur carrier protein ThiS [Phascolarctobacterium sp.]MBR5589599.1 sulfur carrier protein ThiS [Phascolarctobacterium sp.]
MKVNGQQEFLEEAISLAELLAAKGYASSKVAVELNGRIVSRTEYASTILQDEDVLEIVCFVGGG